MKKEVTLNKPNQLISILPKESINLIQQKSYNVFLRNAQREIKFGDKYEEISENIKYIFKIPCKQLEKKAGLNKKDYDYIKEELEKLLSIVISVVDKENKNNWRLFHFLDNIEKEDNYFKYSLDWTIVKALKEHNFFTKLDLLQVAKLKSKYSVIFYELSIRYKNYKIPKMTIEEIRKRTNTKNKYSAMKDFKKNVLDKACEEISEKTDIKLSYITEKKGRRISYIDFSIKKKKQEKISPQLKNIEPEYSKQTLKLFNLLPKSEQVETNKKILANLLKDHSFRYLKADIKYAKGSNPNNFMGFLKSSCQNNHYSASQIEKEEKKKELAKKRKEEERKRKELTEKIEKKARKKALKKYETLSPKELNKYDEGYNRMAKIVPKRIRPNKKDYIIGLLEEEFKEELKDLLGVDFLLYP